MKEQVSHAGAGEMWSKVSEHHLMDLVCKAVRRMPESPAMIFEDGVVISRSQFLDRAERFAGGLRERVAPGDRVAIMLGQRAEWMIAWLAVVANRATVVSINPSAQKHDASHILRDSGSVLVVAGEEQRPLLEAILSDVPDVREILCVSGPEPDGLLEYSKNVEPLSFEFSHVRRTDITNVYYTSGTTGLPKGCMLDHERWLRSLDVDLRTYPRAAEDRLLSCLQFFYYDPALLLLMGLKAGGPTVFMRRFSVSRFWDVVRENDVTDLLGIASIPALLLKAAPSPRDRDHKVKAAVQAAAPPALHREMNERWGFPWVENYGITEGGILMRMPLEHVGEMAGSGSMGVPCPEVTIRLVDEEHRDVGVDEPGEILVSAPAMFRGYLNRPEETVKTLAGGWLHTGDVARRDERGFYYFLGRKKDIIRRSGENLSASEVEEVLRSHPKILEAAVIPVPDELRGEEVKAYILPVEGESPQTLPPEEVVAWCEAKLARFKVPRYLEYRIEDFERTPSMRVRKELLKREREDLTAGAWDREQASPPDRGGCGRRTVPQHSR